MPDGYQDRAPVHEGRDISPEERVARVTADRDGQLVMLFYILCDVSYSMYGDLAALQDGLRRLVRVIANHPDLEDTTQLAVLSFSDTARVITPLGRPSELQPPTLHIEGGTNYGVAFRMLAQTIEADRKRLKDARFQIFRPCAFFLSDGEPNDSDWHRTFTDSLTYDKATKRGMRAHPTFIPFGFRDAREADLKRLAYPPGKAKWFHSRTTSIEDALLGIFDVIKKSVIDTSKSPQAGQPTLLIAQPDPNTPLNSGDSEYEDDYV